MKGGTQRNSNKTHTSIIQGFGLKAFSYYSYCKEKRDCKGWKLNTTLALLANTSK